MENTGKLGAFNIVASILLGLTLIGVVALAIGMIQTLANPSMPPPATAPQATVPAG
ncbi:MAG TPA: hypothetical protein VEA15_05280 [Caulobacteraceae bacterium]|nr:hypothetical protein [Caulobacteraceae bacterium]